MRITLWVFLIFIAKQLTAQVPVSQEPRHHLVFENEKVRILNVLLPVGDTTQYHLHATPSVFISLTKTKTGSQRINEEPEFGTSAEGNIWFENLNPPNTKVHRVWNMDTSVFHVIDIELLSKHPGVANDTLDIMYAKPGIDSTWITTYDIYIKSNEAVNIEDKLFDCVVVAINQAKINLTENGTKNTSNISSGKFYWLPVNTTFSIRNLGNSPAKFVLIRIK